MVHKLIEFSLRNRLIVLLISMGLLTWGIFSIDKNPIDAIPDLSEYHVIGFTKWRGRSPQVIEDQVTYPLAQTANRVYVSPLLIFSISKLRILWAN